MLNTIASSKSSLDTTKINNDTTICDNESMRVGTSNAKIIKQNYCVFCLKLQTQTVRHLKKVYRNEPDVKRFTALPKKNFEWKKIIDTLQKNGTFKFNTNSELNDGQLIICRRSNEKYKKSYKKYIK